MTETLRILHVEDNSYDAEMIGKNLEKLDYIVSVKLVNNKNDYIKAIEEETFDLVFCDFKIPSFNGLEALSIARKKYPDIPVIFISGTIGEEQAVNLLKSGATDYILKDNTTRLPAAIKRALQEVEEKNKLREAEKQLIIAKEKAEESDRLKTAFLNQVSHEIRTPLNIILNISDLLREEFKHKMDKELLILFQGMDSAGKRLMRTIDMILNMSSLQAGSYKVRHINFNLSDVLCKIINEFNSQAESKNIELNYYSDLSKPVITNDEYLVSQLFICLLDNALKYTLKGSVNVSIFSDSEDRISFSVKDTGIGIAQEYIPHLFKPFSQESIGYSRKFEGNGLGLALTKKYSELVNADISVDSKKDEGSTFTVSFNSN